MEEQPTQDSPKVQELQNLGDYVLRVDAIFKELGLLPPATAKPGEQETSLSAFMAIHAAALRMAERLVAAEMERDTTRRRYASLLNLSPLAIIFVDANDVICDWNSGAERLYGWAAADTVGQSLPDILIPERYRDRHRAGFQRFVRTLQSSGILNHTFRTPALHRSGQEIEIEALISATLVDREYQFVSFSRDAAVPIAEASPHLDAILARTSPGESGDGDASRQ